MFENLAAGYSVTVLIVWHFLCVSELLLSAHVDAVIFSSCCLRSAGALVTCSQSVQKSAGFKVAASFQLERLKLVELVEVSAAAGRVLTNYNLD